MQTGTKKTCKFILLHKTAEVLSSDTSALLFAYYALTGCDSTSALKGQGKKKVLNMIKIHKHIFKSLFRMGESFEPDDSLENQCEKFICKVYDPKENESSINELRYKMFCRNSEKSENLPLVLTASNYTFIEQTTSVLHSDVRLHQNHIMTVLLIVDGVTAMMML